MLAVRAELAAVGDVGGVAVGAEGSDDCRKRLDRRGSVIRCRVQCSQNCRPVQRVTAGEGPDVGVVKDSGVGDTERHSCHELLGDDRLDGIAENGDGFHVGS